ncbi:hypothetical protein N0V85_007253 [Neurospora sp. IMI 360204]|nr:hypothetical protein N0V85_007253 [Neurospora sp. IMI 360204]
MPDGKRARLPSEDRQPSSTGSTPNGNDAGDLSESRGSGGDTRSGHRTASGTASYHAAGTGINNSIPQTDANAPATNESKAQTANTATSTTTGAAAVEDKDKGLGLWETDDTTFSVEKGWIMVENKRKKKKKKKKSGNHAPSQTQNKSVKPGGSKAQGVRAKYGEFF